MFNIGTRVIITARHANAATPIAGVIEQVPGNGPQQLERYYLVKRDDGLDGARPGLWATPAEQMKLEAPEAPAIAAAPVVGGAPANIDEAKALLVRMGYKLTPPLKKSIVRGVHMEWNPDTKVLKLGQYQLRIDEHQNDIVQLRGFLNEILPA